MASTGKRKTTMAKLNRERRLLDRRIEKKAKKDARKRAAALNPGGTSDELIRHDQRRAERHQRRPERHQRRADRHPRRADRHRPTLRSGWHAATRQPQQRLHAGPRYCRQDQQVLQTQAELGRQSVKRIFGNGRYANVTATLALLMAMGGTSYAAVTISGANIKDRSVKRNDLVQRPRRRGAHAPGARPLRPPRRPWRSA